MKGQLLNRGILQIEFEQLFSRPCGTGLRPGLDLKWRPVP
jgi:hypothetical protein